MTSPTASGKTREEIAQAYRSEPWWYDVRGFFILTFAYNDTLPRQLRFFGEHMAGSGARHLELACGTGTLLELVLRWRRFKRMAPPHIVGVDYAESMLAGARHRFRGQAGLEFLHGDAAELPFPEGHFDTVNIANAVHCFPAPEAAMAGTLKVLKPGGTVAMNVLLEPQGQGLLDRIARRINDWGRRKGILYRPYLKAEVLQMVQRAGFETLNVEVHGHCLDVLARRPVA